MKKIKLMNKIAAVGTDIFDRAEYEVGADLPLESADAIMVRSADMHDTEFPPCVLAIARAGAGVNNIPVEKCAEEGIVVFNTPGANANGVKELTVCALALASRDIAGGIMWASSLTGDVASQVEKGKSAFAGVEFAGKTLGVIGLGAIGGQVANAALALGMNVLGYDPFLTVDAAWNLSGGIGHAKSLDEIYAAADYITLHVPAVAANRGMINRESIAKMKDGAILINNSRGGLIVEQDLADALNSGKLCAAGLDVASEEPIRADNPLLTAPNCFLTPHIAWTTKEALQRLMDITTGNLRSFLAGKGENIVNS